MTVTQDTAPKQESWTAARFTIIYDNDGERHTKEIKATLEEFQQEQRDKAQQQGATPEQLEKIVLDAELFQGLAYQAARQLSTSPIFHKDEHSGTVEVLGPWHIVKVIVIPVHRNRILTPNNIVHVPKQRAN